MNKKVKIIVISSIISVVLIAIIISLLVLFKLNKVVSILTIDINPSISLSLNYKDEVIKLEGLNEDGKKLIENNDLKEKSLEKTIENITTVVIENGYITKEDNFILISSDKNNLKDSVAKVIEKTSEKEKIECNIITEKISDEIIEISEKYGISKGKASYLESIIKENEDLSYEDLKDKSISEINDIISNTEDESDKNNTIDNTEKEEIVKPTEPDTKPQTPAPSKPSQKPTYNPPDPSDRSGAWCDFLNSLPPDGSYVPEMPGYVNDTAVFVENAKQHFPDDSNWSTYYSSITQYRTATYCSAGIIIVGNYDNTKQYTVYLNNVNFELLEFVTDDLPSPNIDENGAYEIVKEFLNNQYGVDINDCNTPNFYYHANLSFYEFDRYSEWQFSCLMGNINKSFYVTINSQNGNIKNHWTS